MSVLIETLRIIAYIIGYGSVILLVLLFAALFFMTYVIPVMLKLGLWKWNDSSLDS